jgi:hypothetical protein
MATAYPGALDTTGSQLRTDIASTDDLDASGKEHDTMHVNAHGAVVALETKLGIGASAASGASDGDALTKQADGSTAWEAVPSGVSWSGSTANGLATYGSSSSVVSESTATYDGTTLQLTTSGGGLKLDNLDSSNANTLDDYEEGTFTGTFSSTGGTITVNASYNTGTYIKIGKLCWIQFSPVVGSISSPTGGLYVEGMPFTSMPAGTSTSYTYNRLHANIYPLQNRQDNGNISQIPHGFTQVSFDANDCAASSTALAAHVKVGTECMIAGCYITA